MFDGDNPRTPVVVETDGTTVTVRPGDPPAGAVRFTGPTVELVDALSRRGPFPCEVADDDLWLVSGLATVFDQVA